MNKQRTGGMTAIGVLNIIFGSLGTLLSLLVVAGGGLLAAGGAAMEAELGADAEGMGGMAATGGAIIVAIGLAGAVTWAMLFIGGIGVLKLASWGRTLCMVCAGALSLLTILNFTQNGFGLGGMLLIGYSATMVGLFMKAEWKAAFGGDSAAAGSVGADEEFRAAA